MSPADTNRGLSCERQKWFTTTHWSVVLAAGEAETQVRTEALERLCSAYWQPLYSFTRRLGYSAADAQDLTQSFLANLLVRRSLAGVSPQKGRFRTFLLRSLKYFLADERDKVRTQKRGGGATLLSLDAQQAEDRYALEPVDENDPEKIFERRWALTLLERVLKRLEVETTEAGKQDQWRDLKVYLLDDGEAPSYAELAARLGLSVSAVKMSVSRLRQRYGQLLRAEIADTVCTDGEVEEELHHLLAVLRR